MFHVPHVPRSISDAWEAALIRDPARGSWTVWHSEEPENDNRTPGGLDEPFVFPGRPAKENRDMIAFLGSKGSLNRSAKMADP